MYTGKEFDQETGLYYYGARYYDPRTSVWQSVDPILEKYLPSGDPETDGNLPGMGGVFNSANLAAYTQSHNNPVKYSDPDGNAPVEYSGLEAAYSSGPLKSYCTSCSFPPSTREADANAVAGMKTGVGIAASLYPAGRLVRWVGKALSGILSKPNKVEPVPKAESKGDGSKIYSPELEAIQEEMKPTGAHTGDTRGNNEFYQRLNTDLKSNEGSKAKTTTGYMSEFFSNIADYWKDM